MLCYWFSCYTMLWVSTVLHLLVLISFELHWIVVTCLDIVLWILWCRTYIQFGTWHCIIGGMNWGVMSWPMCIVATQANSLQVHCAGLWNCYWHCLMTGFGGLAWCKFYIVAGCCCLALIQVWTNDFLAVFLMNCCGYVVVCRFCWSIFILHWLAPYGCIFLSWLSSKTTHSPAWCSITYSVTFLFVKSLLTWHCRLWNNVADLWCLKNFEAMLICISWFVTGVDVLM